MDNSSTDGRLEVRLLAAIAAGAEQAFVDLCEHLHSLSATDFRPIGAMGNERPIEIVTERWHSADIDALVRHRHFDPRFGETTYQLVNVARGETIELELRREAPAGE